MHVRKSMNALERRLIYENGTRRTALLTPGQVPDTNWKAVGTGDLDGDGQFDIVWQNIADGRTSAWLMRGLNLIDGTLLSPSVVPDTNWQVVGPR